MSFWSEYRTAAATENTADIGNQMLIELKKIRYDLDSIGIKLGAMKSCKNCNRSIAISEAKFCPFCGTEQ